VLRYGNVTSSQTADRGGRKKPREQNSIIADTLRCLEQIAMGFANNNTVDQQACQVVPFSRFPAKKRDPRKQTPRFSNEFPFRRNGTRVSVHAKRNPSGPVGDDGCHSPSWRRGRRR